MQGVCRRICMCTCSDRVTGAPKHLGENENRKQEIDETHVQHVIQKVHRSVIGGAACPVQIDGHLHLHDKDASLGCSSGDDGTFGSAT